LINDIKLSLNVFYSSSMIEISLPIHTNFNQPVMLLLSFTNIILSYYILSYQTQSCWSLPTPITVHCL